jgi:hypothetical protein
MAVWVELVAYDLPQLHGEYWYKYIICLLNCLPPAVWLDRDPVDNKIMLHATFSISLVAAGCNLACPFVSRTAVPCMSDVCQLFPCTESPSIRSTCVNIPNGEWRERVQCLKFLDDLYFWFYKHCTYYWMDDAQQSQHCRIVSLLSSKCLRHVIRICVNADLAWSVYLLKWLSHVCHAS